MKLDMNLYQFHKFKIGDKIRIIKCSSYNCEHIKKCNNHTFTIVNVLSFRRGGSLEFKKDHEGRCLLEACELGVVDESLES